jgi:hypothetical protein
MRWAWHIECMYKIKNAFWSEYPNGRDLFEDIGIDERAI